jgi:hypothetical protein
VKQVWEECAQPEEPAVSASLRSLSALRFEIEVMRRELIDLAFDLERRGRSDAADLAVALSAQLGGLNALRGAEET